MRVALTGGIASGKSTVAGMLRELGALVIDSDVLARAVVAPDTPGLAAVVDAFGPEVLAADGSLDRARVAELVFADDDARRRLEAIVHPLVFEAAADAEARAPEGSLVVHDIPLLAESLQRDPERLAGFVAVLVVDADPEEQVRRIVADRGWTQEEARARMAAQASREQRRAIATYLIDNTGDLDHLRRQIADVHARLTA